MIYYTIRRFYRDQDNYGTSELYDDTLYTNKSKADRLCQELNDKWGEYDSYYKRWTYYVSDSDFEIDEGE